MTTISNLKSNLPNMAIESLLTQAKNIIGGNFDYKVSGKNVTLYNTPKERKEELEAAIIKLGFVPSSI